MRIALLEDEDLLAEMVCLWIEAQGHQCERFADGRQFINALKRDTYDLLVLDWIVPGVDGEGVLIWVRENINWPIPVIFMTQRDSEEDIVKIFGLGADDYVTKPVREKEMIARITALARRAKVLDTNDQKKLEFSPYLIDLENNSVFHHGEHVPLTQKEFELVAFLFRNLGRIVSREHILESIWGHSKEINTRTADTHISRIRNKLGLVPDNGWRISSIYHHGYRLEQVSQAESKSA